MSVYPEDIEMNETGESKGGVRSCGPCGPHQLNKLELHLPLPIHVM